MMGAWVLLVRKALLDSGRSPAASLVAECLGRLIGLAVYWFTSRAIGPALSFAGDYFTFVVVGETTLFVPMVLLSGTTSNLRSGATDGTLELFLTLPLRAPVLVSFQTLALVPREVFGMIVSWAVAATVFGLSVPPWSLGELLALQLFAVPLFLGIGLVAGAALVRFGRGHAALAQAGALAAILSGAYFPLSAVPEPIRAWSVLLSPFTWVMETARAVMASGWTADTWKACLLWLAAGAVSLVAGWAALDLSFSHVRRRGDPLLLPQ